MIIRFVPHNPQKVNCLAVTHTRQGSRNLVFKLPIIPILSFMTSPVIKHVLKNKCKS